MSNKKKGGNDGNWRGDDEEKLQAVVIADSFNRKFTPITQECPRALLPLCNREILEYTIEYLLTEGVKEIIVFCCALGERIREYVKKKWKDKKIHCVLSSDTDCISLGDALREIDREGLIRSDFLLVPGDLVSNLKLSQLVEEHKAKRKKEKNLVMSLLYREMNPGHFSRCSEDNVFLAVDSETNKILQYQKSHACTSFSLSIAGLNTRKQVDVRYDLGFTHIAICSPQAAPLFTDNFDYQTLDDFIKGVLINEDIMGDQINARIIRTGYSARVSDLHMYNAVSLDLMNRWIYPIVPETSKCTYKRNNIYIEPDVRIDKNCKINENVILGSKTHVEEGATIERSVIGANCKIGKNVVINTSYIWDNTTIEDNVRISQSIVCSQCHVKQSVSMIDAILSFGVMIDENMNLKPQTRLSMVKPDCEEDEDEQNKLTGYDVDYVGNNGRGYLWPICTEEEGVVPSLGGDDYESSVEESSEDEDEESLPPTPPNEMSNVDQFHAEVLENLRSGIVENIAADNIALEINASKFKFNISITELCQTLVKAILEISSNDGSGSKQEIVRDFDKNIKTLHSLLVKYYNNTEAQFHGVCAIEDFIISMKNSNSYDLTASILHKLYNQDILEESIILKWFKSPFQLDVSKEEESRKLRENQTLKKLITWLEEAEEESDEDDSE